MYFVCPLRLKNIIVSMPHNRNKQIFVYNSNYKTTCCVVNNYLILYAHNKEDEKSYATKVLLFVSLSSYIGIFFHKFLSTNSDVW